MQEGVLTMLMFKRLARRTWIGTCLVSGLVAMGIGGCATQEPPKAVVRYPTRPPKNVPAFLKGTILEYTDLEGNEPFPVSGWGLVVNLRGTGDTRAPSFVRDFIIRDMIKHGFGMSSQGMADLSPAKVLADPRVAIVKVEAYIPPGTRKDDRLDAYAVSLEGNRTTSLAHGQLLEMELRLNGTQTNNPQGSINVMGKARGDIMINPAYALMTQPPNTAALASMRIGVIPSGAVAKQDWPLMLRLRQADFRLSRAIEQRVDERFQGLGDMPKVRGSFGTAFAADEGIVRVFVPRRFRGDAEHYMGVVTHLYLDDSPQFNAQKAQELAAEAVKPGAPLADISYCWEGLGPDALTFIQPLMTHPSDDVAFAATRAAAFLGDSAALTHLLTIAVSPNNPFRLSAVQVMGAMPDSQRVRSTLRQLLQSDQALVRIEAYRVLAGLRDPSIYSKVIAEKFVLDVVPGKGAPLVYATRQGLPRIALFGDRTGIELPMVMTAFNDTLSISSNAKSGFLTIFYRGQDVREPVKIISRPDLAELIARLGGESGEGEPRLSFSYGDIVGIVQALSESHKLASQPSDGARQAVSFVMQEPASIERMIGEAPVVASSGDGVGIPDFNPAATTNEPDQVDTRPQ